MINRFFRRIRVPLSISILFILINVVAVESREECQKRQAGIRNGIIEIYTSGDVEKAIGFMEKTLYSCKNDHLTNYNLGIAHGISGNFNKMAYYLSESLDIKPESYLGRLNLAWAYIKSGKFYQGEKIIGELERDGITSATRLIMAFSNLSNDNRANFKRFSKEAAELGRNEKSGYFESLNEIKKESERKTDTWARIPLLVIDLARVYEKIGDFEKAKEHYLKSDRKIARLRLVSMLKNIKADKSDIRYYQDPLLEWNGMISDETEKAFRQGKYLTYPEGIMTFVYPESFVPVPEGVYKIGLPGVRKSDKNYFWEHEVFIKGFSIGKYEVSNIEYMIYVESTGLPSPYNTHNSGYDLWEGGIFKNKIGMQPIVSVSWYDAMKYIEWKSKISGYKLKLPSEERWEKAARGTDGRLYPWGNKTPDLELANFGKHWNDEAKRYTTISDVDQYPRGQSPYGALNMAGNVWEWTSSTYKSFFYDDPSIELESSEKVRNELKVLKGGSWINKADSIKSSFRNRIWPYLKYNGVGFRLTRE